MDTNTNGNGHVKAETTPPSHLVGSITPNTQNVAVPQPQESAEVARLKAELEQALIQNKRLMDMRTKGVVLKKADKGGLSVAGIGRYPATFYPSQWRKILEVADEIRATLDEAEAQPKDPRTGLNGGLSFEKRDY
jgi:hypothetical protein